MPTIFFTRLDVSWKRLSYWRPAFFLVFGVFFWMCFLYDLFQSNECRKAKKNVVAQKKHSLFADFTLLYHLEGMFATCCNHTLEEMFIIGFNICSIWFKSGFGVSSACRVRTQPVTLDDTSTVCTVDEPSQDGFLHSRLVQYLPTFTPKELPSLGNFGIYYINFHIMNICILYIHHQTKYILPLLVYNIYIYICNVYCMCMYIYTLTCMVWDIRHVTLFSYLDLCRMAPGSPGAAWCGEPAHPSEGGGKGGKMGIHGDTQGFKQQHMEIMDENVVNPRNPNEGWLMIGFSSWIFLPKPENCRVSYQVEDDLERHLEAAWVGG